LKKVQIINDIYKCLSDNNVNKLKLTIDKIDDVDFMKDEEFQINTGKYKEEYTFLQKLVRDTINSSVFTAITRLICLSAIPLGNLIIKHTSILYSLFCLVIICIIISFYSLISILKKALKDSN
jgi:hypothetical protein